MKIAIVGTGYVGLVTGVCLADAGHRVTCVDTQPSRVDAILNAVPPFHEPGLPELLRAAQRNGSLSATADLSLAVTDADVIILSVGTPAAPDGGIDLSALAAAAAATGRAMRDQQRYQTVVVKSTVVPGTTDSCVLPILERETGKHVGEFGLATNPEFLREGSAVEDFMNPDRIVIGEWDERSGATTESMYSSFNCPKLHTTLRNAELIKYASNALLATLISFSNEIAALCEAVPGTDSETVMKGLHLDRRLCPLVDGKLIETGILHYLRAGVGFGGSCLPKDANALRSFAIQAGVKMPLMQAVLDVNEARPQQIIRIVEEELGTLRGRTVAVLGLAFKPGTDDLRDSPALAIIDTLLAKGATVRAFDPLALEIARPLLVPKVETPADAESTMRDADAAIVVTAWPEFESWPWAALCRSMRVPLVIDGRNALGGIPWPAEAVYRPIGSAKSTPAREHAVG